MRAALIGLGMVAKTHVAAIGASGARVELAGIHSRSAEHATDFADETSKMLGYRPKLFGSIEAIAADPGIDFVILATPPDARRDIVRTLSAAGKHILMEKPVERTASAAAELVEICAKAQVKLGIVLQHRMRAEVQALHATLQAGELGQIATVEIRIPWWRDQAYYDVPGRGSYARDGGGVLITQAIHTLDLALTLAGPVTAVQAKLHRSSLHRLEAEDWAAGMLQFGSGAIGNFMASTAAFPGETETIALHGTKCSARLSAGYLNLAFHNGKTRELGQPTESGGGADPMAFSHTWHQAIQEDFVDAISADRAPAASGRSALAVHRLIDAIGEADRTGGWVETGQGRT